MIQDDLAGLKPYCRRVVPRGKTWSRYAMAYENGKVIALCRDVTPPLATFGRRLKNYS